MLNCYTHTCEAALALLLAAGDGEELIGEQVKGCGSAVGVRLKAAQDEGLSLRRHGLGDLWMDLKHAHLKIKDTQSVQTGAEAAVMSV